MAQQAQEGTFSIVLYLVALVSLSLAMWLLVVNRRMRQGEFELGSEDQTDEVLEDLDTSKTLPDIAKTPSVEPLAQPVALPQRAPPPLPPTGLPEGWTLDQWSHFGWQYVESMKK